VLGWDWRELHPEPRLRVFRGQNVAVGRLKPLVSITGELVDKYVNWRRSLGSGNSIAALNGELRTLRRLFRLAQEWGVAERIPAVHELPGAVGRERVISFQEEALYLKATLRDMATLAVDTGLRPNSELFPLEWENVRLEPSANSPHGYIHVRSGKRPKSVRNVPLTPRARALLEMRRSATRGSRYVFPGPGRSGHITTIQHAHEHTIRRVNEAGREKALQKDLVKPFEFYCWRHTFGTRCAESGMDKFSLARLMGHSSPHVADGTTSTLRSLTWQRALSAS